MRECGIKGAVKELTWKKKEDTPSSEIRRKEVKTVIYITCKCGIRRLGGS